MSCICEVISPGIQPVSSQVKDQHRAPFSDFCKRLEDEGYLVISDVSCDESYNNAVKYSLQSRHTYSCAFSAVVSSRDQVLGFVAVEYCQVSPQVGSNDLKETLTELTTRLASFVEVRISNEKEGRSV